MFSTRVTRNVHIEGYFRKVQGNTFQTHRTKVAQLRTAEKSRTVGLVSNMTENFWASSYKIKSTELWHQVDIIKKIIDKPRIEQ